jgi:hypothetical protein
LVNKEEYFPMKLCVLIVPVDVTARTTKHVLEVVLPETSTHQINTHKLSI